MPVENRKYSIPNTLNLPIINILEIIKQPLVLIDSECCIQYANPAYYNFFRTFREVTEKFYIDQVSNRDWEVTDLSDTLKQSIAADGLLEKFEVSNKFSQLGNKRMLLEMKPVPQSPERLYLLSFEDHTQERSNNFIQSVTDSIANLVYVYDLELNKMIFINKKSFEALGFTSDEIQQAETDIFTQKIHPDDLPKIKSHRKAVSKLKDGQSATIVYRLQTGKNKWTTYASKDLIFKRNPEGEVIQYVGNATDISDMADANKILASKNAALENSNNELYSFSSIASHDLKEPLRKIQMYGNFVLEHDGKNVSENSKKYLSRMILAADRMQQLIDDLINYSRTDFDKNRFIKTNLNDLLEEVTVELKETIDESGTQIEIADLGTLPVLPSQFRQLFINLIGNAIKYCRKDCHPSIKIFSEKAPAAEMENLQGSASQDFLKITIQDNGIGFHNAYKSKIFEPFQRLHNRSDYSGTGIGLSICKKIAENHKGFITAESEEGKGTRFFVYLPM